VAEKKVAELRLILLLMNGVALRVDEGNINNTFRADSTLLPYTVSFLD